jgi:hypothetical protein
LPTIEKKLKIKISLSAFGSLGRLEFVSGLSDLDPLILFEPDTKKATSKNDIRAAVFEPLARECPWFEFDDRQKVIDGRWADISSVDLKYPVYSLEELIDADDTRTQQRQWQLLLEARSLYNHTMFTETRDRLIPHLKKSAPLTGGQTPAPEVNFQELVLRVPDFYASFEDPTFFYKSSLKHWKTRFLREFYAFSTNLSFVLGWYLLRWEETLHPNYLQASTAIKIMRSTRFAIRFEEEIKEKPRLESHYKEVLADILKRNGLELGPLLLFGENYTTEPARLAHGLLSAVLSRFATCWERLYDSHVRYSLDAVPKEKTNFDARFRAAIKDTGAAAVVDELIELRKSYLRYMAAAAEAIDGVFPKGRLGTYHTVPSWLSETLRPFWSK